jgi:chorismate synthase
LIVRNQDQRSSDYEQLANQYRPSHADFTTQAKYGIRDARGGGRASARETVGRVAAGAIARQVLAQLAGVEIIAWVDHIGQVKANCVPEQVTREAVESHAVRCPDTAAASRMAQAIEEARDQGDTLGGIVRAVARGVPPGWGEPVFDKLEADLAKALMSLPAAKGFESGAGFRAVPMRGSEHNDAFEVVPSGAIRTRTNHSGGIQGGISNGMPIEVSVAFKPVSTLGRNQASVDSDGHPVELHPGGRHDACVLPRAVPMVEACVALVLCDHLLRQRALRGTLD